MLATWLALASAAGLAAALVVARMGLRAQSAVPAAATSVPTATLLMLLAAPVTVDWGGLDWGAVAIFAACGAVFPIGQTLLSFAANRLMGPAMAGALANTTPLFALAFAAALLGEPVTAGRLAGAVAIIGGVLMLAGRGRDRQDWPWWALLLPLASAVLRGLVQPGVKAGLALWADPFAAALVGYCVSATIALGLKAARPRSVVAWPERLLFMLVGVLNAAAVLLMYGALARGPVGLVAPLVATYPLFTLLFGVALLRGERPGWGQAGGVAVTVAGVALVLVG